MELRNKKILVTGADGFIGSHLVERLIKRGAKVRALSFYNSFNYWGWLEDLINIDKVDVVSGDIRDYKFVNDITKGVDIVFHLASLIAIPYSYKSPLSYIRTNIEGAYNICMASLENNIKKIIHTSTSEVYGTAEYVPIDEKHPLKPQSPYSASKIGADSIAMSFFNSYNLPLVIARPFNTYGPRQSARAIIPSIIVQILSGKKRLEVGNTYPTRDFNFINDTINAFIKIAEKDGIDGEVINFGSGKEISIDDLIKKIIKISKSDIEIVYSDERKRPKSSEVDRLLCDNTKAKEILNYEPEFDIDKGLEITFKWFENSENLKKYKSDIYNV